MKAEDRYVEPSGLTGWGAAKKVLQRIEAEDRRALFTHFTKTLGVQSAPALEYGARLLRYYADEADFPSQSARLKQHEVDYIERRVRELLQPYVNAGDRRLARELRGGLAPEVEAA